MIMRISNSVWLGLALLASVPAWSQEDKPNPMAPAASGPLISALANNDNSEDPMLTPPPVSGAIIRFPLRPRSDPTICRVV